MIDLDIRHNEFWDFDLQSTMNTFGISIFNEPEEMIALYLGMKTQTAKFLAHLQKLLQRTKSPPIAITYTYHFLKDKTEEELSLDVIRFVSQLADISQGISMSTSLNGILTQSSFLTELRHSLTHKTMVKGSILLLSKTMILEELQSKFWKLTIDKLRETYCLSKAKVHACYNNIYQQQCKADLAWINIERQLSYFVSCSNYEYKQHIARVIEEFKENKLQSSQLIKYYEEVSQQKQLIFITILLQQYLQAQIANEHFTAFVMKLIKIINPQHFNSQVVFRQCQKSYFLRFLPHAKFLFSNLPEGIQTSVEQFWKQKEREVGKLFHPL